MPYHSGRSARNFSSATPFHVTTPEAPSGREYKPLALHRSSTSCLPCASPIVLILIEGCEVLAHSLQMRFLCELRESAVKLRGLFCIMRRVRPQCLGYTEDELVPILSKTQQRGR